jgi:CRISPR-associated protein Cst2
MSKHLFGMILTHQGIYANNRGENEGNATTIQKVLRNGEIYSTVSAESIRYALREGWQLAGHSVNRRVVDHRSVEITDREFAKWAECLDDDILGFMHARNETLSRRGPLEITRAISVSPWRGEIMHNFASPGSNPSMTANDPIPYAVEVHDTRYQFGFAVTPEFFGQERLNERSQLDGSKKKERLRLVLEGLLSLRRVGGNHARYFTDYSPEVVVLRWTDDPAPRFLYCFEENELGSLSLGPLLKRIEGGDIEADEIIIGTALDIAYLRQSAKEKSGVKKPQDTASEAKCLEQTKAWIKPGVKKAVEFLLQRIEPSSL